MKTLGVVAFASDIVRTQDRSWASMCQLKTSKVFSELPGLKEGRRNSLLLGIGSKCTHVWGAQKTSCTYNLVTKQLQPITTFHLR